MIRLLGVLLMVVVLYGVLMASDENARSLTVHETLLAQVGFYGVITLGVGVLIVSGGIDLSIGSVVGLGAVTFGLMLSGPMTQRTAFLLSGLAAVGPAYAAGAALHWCLPRVAPRAAPLLAAAAGAAVLVGGWWVGYRALEGRHLPPWACGLLVLWVSGQIGLLQGLLVTRLRVQPFLVTLCGLFIYRGLARWASTSAVGLGVDTAEAYRASVAAFRSWLVGSKLRVPLPGVGALDVPQQLVLVLAVALVLGLFLHGTRYGRYLFAIGANEDAARYAGIPTEGYKVLAYVICSLLAGLGGILTILQSRSVAATNVGSLFELYAITGAVLGGCSLRGGEGSVAGMALGAAVLPLLRQLCSFGGISNELEYAVIGLALLAGTVVDELLKRRAARRTGGGP